MAVGRVYLGRYASDFCCHNATLVSVKGAQLDDAYA